MAFLYSTKTKTGGLPLLTDIRLEGSSNTTTKMAKERVKRRREYLNGYRARVNPEKGLSTNMTYLGSPRLDPFYQQLVQTSDIDFNKLVSAQRRL